jgi:hypothetical protein
MDLRLATLKSVSFYLPHNVLTLNQCRKFSCGTVVCKHFASYQGYPNYRWDLTLYAKGEKSAGTTGRNADVAEGVYTAVRPMAADVQCPGRRLTLL